MAESAPAARPRRSGYGGDGGDGSDGRASAGVAGLILAGGRAERMGGTDKGLLPWRGRPLVAHVRDRLAPQAGEIFVSANRNAEAYAAYGTVVADLPELAGFQGPLAGVASALPRVAAGWLAVAPCDTPLLPRDMVARLLDAASAARAPLAVARAGGRRQPVCMALNVSLADDLLDYLRGGGRRVDAWQARAGAVEVPFDDAAAFFNVNTPQDMEPGAAPGTGR